LGPSLVIVEHPMCTSLIPVYKLIKYTYLYFPDFQNLQTYMFEGGKKKGRPKLTWWDGIQSTIQKEPTEDVWEDRDNWRLKILWI
jgi:hypothetical protein